MAMAMFHISASDYSSSFRYKRAEENKLQSFRLPHRQFKVYLSQIKDRRNGEENGIAKHF